MNPQLTPLLAAVILVLAMIVFMVIALSRYMKVGPNQVLIVSGRKVHLPDGRCVGFRLVKGGGTFVFLEKNYDQFSTIGSKRITANVCLGCCAIRMKSQFNLHR